ncbi:hypothetical protein KC327_g11075 [Hortaea werneckii]|nr:hypothetical protein KC358_g11131 [Hortaea werneckii]KAI6817972.1 hypothetical protein KC350_g10462 [Hortaea werneckii]KAI6915398.1 hypothetical protein KC348_g12059 [Hortaea werneckii]KAI6928415.1 hypothetical protein KC341_g11547 [Hortaea werneckii]KAI7066242.1 hypothetical protein KC327_g11075 [Hortaea werneckii]
MAGNQPLSFKTVPGRNRTQKWTQAKTYNYDGDEWGGYDPYDEYGDYDEQAASASQTQPARPQRQNSFDAGDERRNFSAGYVEHSRGMSPTAASTTSTGARRPSTDHGARAAALAAAGRSSHEYDMRPRGRNFTNPEQVPPPLAMHSSPARSTGSGVSAQQAFPPRKSSISNSAHSGSPAPSARAAPAAKPDTDKPLPFVRPSDIYKRVPEERERERANSMDSSRRSMDSNQREPSPAAISSPTSSSMGAGRRPSLDPVAESRESRLMEEPHTSSLPAVEERAASPEFAPQPEYMPLSSLHPGTDGTEESQRKTSTGPLLPPVSRISGFGSDFIGGTSREPSQEPEAGQAGRDQDHVQSTISRVIQSPVEPTSQDNASAEASGASHDPEYAAETSDKDGGAAALQHQPSSGFRSVVNTAFDRKDDNSVPATPLSRDNSGSHYSRGTDGLSRSNTDSTAGISPIMSRVPSAATAQQRPSVIAEEPATRTPTQSRPASGAHEVARKPSPGHTRDVSNGSASSIVQPGYRRSLDPPSSGNSPARTPALEDTTSRRLSTPLAAEHVAETPDIPDQAAEMPEPHLSPAETPASEVAPLPSPRIDTELPTRTRGRSGTDYSTREADLAHEVNASPEQGSYSPPVAEESRDQQALFLRTHFGGPSGPNSPALASPALPSPSHARPTSPGKAGFGVMHAGTPGSTRGDQSGRESPAKGRVREIAENYNSLESSRRNSAVSTKSSWSNFRNESQENLAPLQRKGTGGSQLGLNEIQNESLGGTGQDDLPSGVEDGQERPTPALNVPGNDGAADRRTDAERPMSFRPHLPGEWVSFGPTPAGEEPSSVVEGSHGESSEAPRSSPSPRAPESPDEDATPDFTPTNQSRQISGHDTKYSPAFNSVKGAGAALGASLMASSDMTSQARDFGSNEPATVDYPEMQPKVQTGEVSGFLKPQALRPSAQRSESTATDYSEMTEGGSTITEMPPSPPKKDLDDDGLAPDREPDNGSGGRPVSSYFAGAVPPLRTGRSREPSQEPAVDRSDADVERPQATPSMSPETGAEDMESDRLREEIERSLDSPEHEGARHENTMEDAERTQDALDAPDNERREEEGVAALPATEIDDAQARGVESQATSAGRPGLLNQRFSWENRPEAPQMLTPPRPRAEQQREYDIAPEMPYERPRSRQLHIVNNEDAEDESPVEETAKSFPVAAQEPDQAERGMTESLPVGAASAATGRALSVKKSDEGLRGDAMKDVEPSPIADDDQHNDTVSDNFDSRLPSYYQSDLAGEPSSLSTAPQPPEKNAASPTSPSAAPDKRQSTGRIPPFREILAIKSSPQRIQAYNDTRHTFADMDTGLTNWMSAMLTQHPEHASLSTDGSSQPPSALQASAASRHKHSPSILKIPKLGGGGSGGNGQDSAAPSGSYASDTAPHPPKTPGGGRDLDMDRVQQRGKDLMKNASVLGGKAQAGARGLFAKGKNRFGGGGGKRESDGGGGKAEEGFPTVVSGPLPTGEPSGGVVGTPGSSGSARIEAWNEPDAVLPSSTAATPKRTATPSRLGVLPSPTWNTHAQAEEEAVVVARGGEGHAPSASLDAKAVESVVERDVSADAGVGDQTGSKLSQREKGVEDEDVRRAETDAKAAEDDSVVPLTSRDVSAERPQQNRRVSALATLPSQQRVFGSARPASPATPAGLSLRQEVAEHETYPVESGFEDSKPSRGAHEQSGRSHDDDPGARSESADLVGDVPLGVMSQSGEPKEPGVHSGDGAIQDDQRSAVSAEGSEIMRQRQQGLSVPQQSRRSSISSLGSPDTVVGQRASMVALQKVTVSPGPPEAMPRGGTQSSITDPDMQSSPKPATLAAVPVFNPAAPSQQRSMSLHAPTTDHQRFMNRTYRGRVVPPGRAFSYTPLGRDASGAPMPEAISAQYSEGGEHYSGFDLNGIGGQPLSTTPSQQHPVFRNSGIAPPPSEYEQMRASRSGATTPLTHSRQVSGDAGDRSSRRYSDFFRGPSRGPSPSAEAMMASAGDIVPPPANLTGPQYGLEEPDAMREDAQSPVPLRRPSDTQTKRRSSIWDSFKRTPSIASNKFIAQAPAPPVVRSTTAPPAEVTSDASVPPPHDGKGKVKMLTKSQRATSSTTPPETPKKKSRLSRLGSLLGRSNTSGNVNQKPNKLTKAAPPSQGQPRPYGYGPARAAKGYEAYEAMRRQQIPDLHGAERGGGSSALTMSSPYSQPKPHITIPSGPPPQGWYGPSEGQSPAGSSSRPPSQGWYGPSRSLPTTPLEQPVSQPASPQRHTPGSQYRSLHSERYQRGLQHASLPDAFQPAAPVYGAPQFPMGPPTIQPSTQVNASKSAWPQPQTQWRQPSPVRTYRPQVQRQDSAGSTGYPFPRQSTSPAPASVTPVSFAPPAGPPPGRRPVQHQRMSSLDEELMAHTPARLYPDQQAASMSDSRRYGVESPQPSRTMSWSQSPAPNPPQPQPYTVLAGPPPGAVGAIRRSSRGGSPMENYYPTSYPPGPVGEPEPDPEPMGYYTPDQLVRARMLAHEQQPPPPQPQPQGWGGGGAGVQHVRSSEMRPVYGAGGRGSAEYFPPSSSSSPAPYYPNYQAPVTQEQQVYAPAPGHFAPQQAGYGIPAQQRRYYAQ